MATFDELRSLSPEDRILRIELEKLDIERSRINLENTKIQVSAATAAAEQTKAQAEKLKAEVEREKAKLEGEKARWTAISTLVPLLVALGTIVLGVVTQWQQHAAEIKIQTEQQQAQASLKIAEWLVTSASGPDEVVERARALGDLFPALMSAKLVKHIEEHPYVFKNSSIEARLKFFDVVRVAKDEKQEKAIVKEWSNLFPCDPWLPSFGVAVSKKDCDLTSDVVVGDVADVPVVGEAKKN